MAYWITGAGHINGIGGSIALHLLKNNESIVINGRNIDQIWYDYKKQYDDNLQIIKGDITDADIQNKFISFVDKHENFKNFDGLINNASTIEQANVYDRKDWEKDFVINVIVPYELSSKAKVNLKKSKGSILNISSIVSKQLPFKNNMVYSIAKAAQNQLTLAMSAEFAPDVRVNSLLPGLFISDRFHLKNGNNSQIKIEKYKEKSLLNDVLGVDETVNAALFLLKNKNITGQLLPICNGASLNLT